MPGKSQISFILIILINFLFTFKYLGRVTPYALLISLGYVVFLIAGYLFLQKHDFKIYHSNFIFWFIVLLYTVCYFVVFKHVRVEQLNVDRWSVIDQFWQAVFQGNYPYGVKSHMGNYPGPMPVYFILALPFYLIHEIGYFSVGGFLILVYFFRKVFTPKDSFIIMILLISFTALFWEIASRSTILINAVLFLIFLHWLMHVDFNKGRNFYITAIVGGLLLSTRSIFSVVLIITSIFMLRNSILTLKRLFGWTAILLITFGLTFSPFLIFYFHDFFRINPFIIESDFLLPAWYVPIFFTIAIGTAFLFKKIDEIYFWSGLVLFLVFAIYFVSLGSKTGFVSAYLNSEIDISYSLFSLPFFLYSLRSLPEKING